MEQRDLIKEEVERLGQALGRLIALVIGTDGNNTGGPPLEVRINEGMMEGLGISVRSLLDLPVDELRTLVMDRNLNADHVEDLARLFDEWSARETVFENQNLLARRSLDLYDLAGELSGNYSFTRAKKEAALREFLRSRGE